MFFFLRELCSVYELSSSVKETLSPEEINELLFSYMPKITGEQSLDTLLVHTADLGQSLVMPDRCSLWLLDYSNDECWTKVAQGVGKLKMPMQAGAIIAKTHQEKYDGTRYPDKLKGDDIPLLGRITAVADF
jgi:hypothetical protein